VFFAASSIDTGPGGRSAHVGQITVKLADSQSWAARLVFGLRSKQHL